jgi:hypothetical protein
VLKETGPLAALPVSSGPGRRGKGPETQLAIQPKCDAAAMTLTSAKGTPSMEIRSNTHKNENVLGAGTE